ncbi:oocyte zinc finger protein XlCOF20-like [Galleria mellonella]|uniref:Oocyte zinc finger protein XlCOF20-like n=1 Tax=Galleria mellonella TaxID=7137 RepID=A0ABM3N0U2_GALME|nr:oocyte zinc finger protein XlCOF20-like [Galleria mellonella]XP_052757212.1 oocyte zinc finger protein XlCOF20-like [Galleria mellonella]
MTLPERENAANFIQYTTVRPFTYLSFPLRFKCFYCDEEYPELNTLLQHSDNHITPERSEIMRTHLKKGKRTLKVDISELKCRLCNVPFSDLNDIRIHLTDEHGKVFSTSGNGMIAYSLKTKDGMFSCHLCTDKFNSFFLLNKHINVHYNNAICELCGKGFVSHKRLLLHREIHGNDQYPCEKCKVTFSSVTKLKYHREKVHSPKKVKPSKCQHCSERFVHHYEKVRHLSEAHGMKIEFKCESCGANYKSQKSLAFHRIKYHTLSISCEICKKPFSERNHLNRHMAMHTEERNFACSLCTKTYRYEKSLKDHMRVHNPNWKFACSECWIGFSGKIKYRKHMAELHAK